MSVVCLLKASLGFVTNQEKSSLPLTQSFEYLGMLFTTQAFSVWPTLERLQRLQDSLLRSRGVKTASAKQLAAVLCQMESLGCPPRLLDAFTSVHCRDSFAFSGLKPQKDGNNKFLWAIGLYQQPIIGCLQGSCPVQF